jgi:hypothetical protein
MLLCQNLLHIQIYHIHILLCMAQQDIQQNLKIVLSSIASNAAGF